MEKNDRIYVAGHTGLIGSALVRRLEHRGYQNLLLASHQDLDLTNTTAVSSFFAKNKPDFVILAAGKVGGIVENSTYPADFINTNLAIQLNVFRSARENSVKRLIFFGSSCMYPKECPQPMPESALLTAPMEPTSMAYAISKFAGLQMCDAYNRQYCDNVFVPVIPNSAYGPFDNFDPESGHVLSALIRRFHHARATGATSVTLWGSGTPRREFVFSEDIADACIFLLGNQSPANLPLNIGVGYDFSILELAEKIAALVGYMGDILWDESKPDGTPRKLLDSSRLHALGWKAPTEFSDGLQATYNWYLQHVANDDSGHKQPHSKAS